MIVVGPSFGPVGEWQYLDLETEVERRDLDDLRELLRRCQVAAQVLANEHLLDCDRVTFTWPGRRVHAALALPATELAATCERHFLELVTPFEYPQTVELTGSGSISHPDHREERVANAAWITASSFGHHDITIKTQVDAWLPFALDARPQSALAALNAPRLEGALTAVGQALGLPVDTESGTKFANHEGLRLVNQIDGSGAPLDCTTLLR